MWLLLLRAHSSRVTLPFCSKKASYFCRREDNALTMHAIVALAVIVGMGKFIVRDPPLFE